MNRKFSKPALALGVALALAGVAQTAWAVPCDNPNPAMCRPDAPTLASTIAARQHYFGVENVDAATGAVRSDLVLLSWLSNSTYAAAINGEVMLLDASLLRREAIPGRTPTTLEEMVSLAPARIFLSKASSGHADLAANIAYRTGAKVIGAQEHCDVVQADARRQFGAPGQVKLLDCTALSAKKAVPGDVTTVSLPSAGVCVRAVTHIDTSAVAPDPSLGADRFDWTIGNDIRDLQYWPPGAPASDGVSTAGGADSPQVMYHFSVAGTDFAFSWNTSAGPAKERAPAVLAALAALPKTDVMLGAVATLNAGNNGLRDPALYVKATQPKVFYPHGHDGFAISFGSYSNGEYVKRALQASLTNVGLAASAQPELRFLFDPTDYSFGPYLTFDPKAGPWTRAGDRPSGAACS